MPVFWASRFKSVSGCEPLWRFRWLWLVCVLWLWYFLIILTLWLTMWEDCVKTAFGEIFIFLKLFMGNKTFHSQDGRIFIVLFAIIKGTYIEIFALFCNVISTIQWGLHCLLPLSDLILFVPSSIFQGRVFLGWTSTKLGWMCLAQGPQRSDAGEARTRGPSVSSQALYHCSLCKKIFICVFLSCAFQNFSVSWLLKGNIWSRSLEKSLNCFLCITVSDCCKYLTST